MQLEVDRGVGSPYSGSVTKPANVYMCWARFTPRVNNFVYFARSTDGGKTWRLQKLLEEIHGNQFCGIAVTRTAPSSSPGASTSSWRSRSAAEGRGTSQIPQYEMFGNRDTPFHGDYNDISAVGSTVLMT